MTAPSHPTQSVPMSKMLEWTAVLLVSTNCQTHTHTVYAINRGHLSIFMFEYTVVCMEGDVRLVDGTEDYEGRVEVCIEEIWSTVCDNGWSLNDANVVCQQLGYLGTGTVCQRGMS